jgi:Zn ribbon nucleic-acid-binding protein
MSPSQPQRAPVFLSQSNRMPNCKHPRVQIVSRDEEFEFVECVECGEVFESSEFKDMAIEERIPLEEA